MEGLGFNMWLKFDGKNFYIKFGEDGKDSIFKIDEFIIDKWIHIEGDNKNLYLNGKKVKG